MLGADPGTAPPAWRARIGIVLQDQGLIDVLTTAEALDLYGGYYPRRRPTDELLRLVGLADRADDRVERLSGGARRRLDVAIGLVGDPELLFLDEPTTGFDPDARRRVWQVIRQLRASGVTIVLTTHYLDEAAALADRIVVLRAGEIVADGRPDALVQAGGRATVGLTIPAGVEPPSYAGLRPAVGRAALLAGDGRPHRHAAVALRVVLRHRLRPRRPDRHPPHARRRLPGADRMTASTTAASRIGSPATIRIADRRTPVRLLGHQLRYELRTMRRNPTLIGFTIGMPLVMMLIFAELMGDEDLGALGVLYKEYLAPRMVVLAILSSSFVSLAISVALRRGNGELKRVRSTPMRAGVVIAALGITTAALSLVSATIGDGHELVGVRHTAARHWSPPCSCSSWAAPPARRWAWRWRRSSTDPTTPSPSATVSCGRSCSSRAPTPSSPPTRSSTASRACSRSAT